MATDIAARALAYLRELAGPEAEFREGQLDAIVELVERRGKVLLVQRTGFGKSAVYFIATRLLREEGLGPTLLFSPLVALMRNQEQMARRMGVRASTLNSANRDEWGSIEAGLAANEIDLLLISPERMANMRFREEVFPDVIKHGAGLVVIDEVHCISDWGHDFRPDYQRLRRVIDGLPDRTPVLGTTATANSRVVADVEQQMGDGLQTFRGALGRDGLRLAAAPRWPKAERLAWLAGSVAEATTSGIVYCLTIADTEQVADWLALQGITAVPYSGADQRMAQWLTEHPDIDIGWNGDPAEVRIAVEQALLSNRVKAVVGTSALGMGFDKPDLGFVFHYQSPGSPIAYYQQVGRAGRALDASWGVLMRGFEDTDIQDYFIDNAFPDQADVEAVLAAMAEAGGAMSIGRLEVAVNLRRARLEKLLKQLEVDGALRQVKGGWERTEIEWTYDVERVEAITALRRREQAEMEAYADTGRCLMVHLRGLLDDTEAEPCGLCSVCDPTPFPSPDPELVETATRLVRRRIHTVEPRRQWPTGLPTVKGRIPPDHQFGVGRALCRLDDGGWGTEVAPAIATGSALGTNVTAAMAELLAEWGPSQNFAWVTTVPSRGSSTLIAHVAELAANTLGVPLIETLRRIDDTRPPQRELANGAQLATNVISAFETTGPIPPGHGLLIDDSADSRWTLTAIASLLADAGAEATTPFVIMASGAG